MSNRQLAKDKPTERQRDMHIKSYLKSSSPEHGVESALQVLHKYEALGLMPPVKTYTRLIVSLFRARSSQFHAQAWDLFAHMRYVAHPKPDFLLYKLMIRACAGTGIKQGASAADPLRALDLWTEMTTEAGYEPDVAAYNTIILVCARSKEYVVDAFRLAREMLDGHRDAYGNPQMRPTRETFEALLVAAKTRKDLPRARWILAEMLKAHEQGVKEGWDNVVWMDNRTMVHVFNAYASYLPPFRREGTRIIGESDVKDVSKVDASANEETPTSTQTDIQKTPPGNARFGIKPPQTHAEVIAEVDALFQRVLDETIEASSVSQPEGDTTASSTEDLRPFSQVKVNGTFLNAYISVYYLHARLEDAHKLYNELFEKYGVDRPSRVYIDALERCARATTVERDCARKFAEDVWKQWLEHEKTLNPRSADARMIERAYAALIRFYALYVSIHYPRIFYPSLTYLPIVSMNWTTPFPTYAPLKPSFPQKLFQHLLLRKSRCDRCVQCSTRRARLSD